MPKSGPIKIEIFLINEIIEAHKIIALRPIQVARDLDIGEIEKNSKKGFSSQDLIINNL